MPIFATGLSLLEPIRGSGGERRNKNQHASTMGSTLVDPSQQEPEKFQQVTYLRAFMYLTVKAFQVGSRSYRSSLPSDGKMPLK